MSHSSQFVRPDVPRSGVALTPRDREILLAIYTHRFLHSEHIRSLLFHGRSRRRVQDRLRRLWEHRFVERYFEPIVLTGVGQTHKQQVRPLYALASHGATVVSRTLPLDVEDIPHTPRQNMAGFGTLSHHLVVTDFLVALSSACRRRSDVEVVAVERESTLRKKVAAWHKRTSRRRPYLMSDGALTLRYPSVGKTVSFHIEVVRAGVRGGNGKLRRRCEQYLTFLRNGFFQEVFGHTHVRAVLFMTPTPERARHYLRVAESLPHGKRLFWFTHYEVKDEAGRAVSRFSESTVLSEVWQHAADQSVLSLIPPEVERLPAANHSDSS